MNAMKKISLAVVALLGFFVAAWITSYDAFAADILGDLCAGSGRSMYAASVYDTDESILERIMKSAAETPASKLMAGAGDVAPVSSADTDAMKMIEVTFESTETEPEVEEGQDKEQDELDGLCVADVTNSMNVRQDPSEEASLAGYLYRDNVAEILEQQDGWTKIQSGRLTGWAKDEYLLFGDEAKERIRDISWKTATVNTETLRVRGDADEEAEINALLAGGTEVEVLDAEGEWTRIRYDDGTEGTGEGFVSNDYISIGYHFNEGETIEEVSEREKESAEKKAQAEEAKKKKEKKEEAPKNNENPPQEAAPGQENPPAAGNEPPAVVDNGAVEATYDDETLLAALIQCECGQQPYEGQLAVGAVVMNRARGSYGSIRNAIYAPYQFGPASSGKLAMTLASGAISGTARQAAKDAIGGLSNIGVATHFRNVRSGHAGIVIGSHVFW